MVNGLEFWKREDIISDFKEKKRRVMEFLDRSGNDALIIGRQDNFSWYTCGGHNRVVITTEAGVMLLVITKQKTYGIAKTMDSTWIFDDMLNDLGIEPVVLKWYEENCEEKASELIKGMKAVSDVSVEGARLAVDEIYKLHYPLTEIEIEKCRWIGRKTDELLNKIANQIKPGMTEKDIEAMIKSEYGQYDLIPEVVLVGSDERIAKYRHPNPSDKKVEKTVLLHPAVKKWGLHANVTRMVYFGDKLPEELNKKYDGVNLMQAATFSMLIPGNDFAGIFETRKQIYKDLGFEDEWRYHFPGGITGYLLCDASVCSNKTAVVSENQAFDWFITIAGVKVEELALTTKNGVEVVSVTGAWPVKEYSFNGQSFLLPQIMLK